jgi:hypothetical protein
MPRKLETTKEDHLDEITKEELWKPRDDAEWVVESLRSGAVESRGRAEAVDRETGDIEVSNEGIRGNGTELSGGGGDGRRRQRGRIASGEEGACGVLD